ncbi:hypothetical protein [Frigoriglobus tundricola]|uniref:TIGR03000 domain-containing protein n=1 Tax=Frigoriglobus tundricola TaxID=2774151 RepID=A0A6M5YNX1_9BACT|nr:hypothetical protein [Frigoriglobus tundricola]QJW95668.1 hypothetical protein FTUN_3222 [Frigoriglobus tundricola]
MSRFFVPALTVVAFATFAPTALAQHGGRGGQMGGGSSQRTLPLSPGVFPGSSIGPGTQFLPQQTPRFVPNNGIAGGGTTQYLRPNAGFGAGSSRFGLVNGVGFGFGYGYGGYGYGYGYNGYGYGNGDYGYSYGYAPVYYHRRHWFGGWYQPNIILGNEFPATLTVQLPSGEVPKEYSLTSPVLKPEERYTFAVNVRWTSGGKTYEAKRDVTLGAGDRSRLLIVSGTEVKE